MFLLWSTKEIYRLGEYATIALEVEQYNTSRVWWKGISNPAWVLIHALNRDFSYNKQCILERESKS